MNFILKFETESATSLIELTIGAAADDLIKLHQIAGPIGPIFYHNVCPPSITKFCPVI